MRILHNIKFNKYYYLKEDTKDDNYWNLKMFQILSNGDIDESERYKIVITISKEDWYKYKIINTKYKIGQTLIRVSGSPNSHVSKYITIMGISRFNTLTKEIEYKIFYDSNKNNYTYLFEAHINKEFYSESTPSNSVSVKTFEYDDVFQNKTNPKQVLRITKVTNEKSNGGYTIYYCIDKNGYTSRYSHDNLDKYYIKLTVEENIKNGSIYVKKDDYLLIVRIVDNNYSGSEDLIKVENITTGTITSYPKDIFLQRYRLEQPKGETSFKEVVNKYSKSVETKSEMNTITIISKRNKLIQINTNYV